MEIDSPGSPQYLTLHKSPNELDDVILPSHASLIFSRQLMALITSGTVAESLIYKSIECKRW